jgi:hypothetical protein
MPRLVSREAGHVDQDNYKPTAKALEIPSHLSHCGRNGGGLFREHHSDD